MRPEVPDRVGPAQAKRNQVIKLIVPLVGGRDSVEAVRLVSKRAGHGSDLSRIPWSADILQGYVEHVARVSFGSGRIAMGC